MVHLARRATRGKCGRSGSGLSAARMNDDAQLGDLCAGTLISCMSERPCRHQTRRACCGPLVVIVGLPVLEEEPRALQELATLPASVQPTSALACPCPMPCSDFR